MRNLLLATLLGSTVAATPCAAQAPAAHATEFDAFHARLVIAAKTGDREKLADLVAFPVDDWAVETKGNVQERPIRDRAEFVARYDTLVTTSMRSHLAKDKPQPLKDGRYLLVWDDADTEFSFEFGYDAKAGYRITSYSIGPR